mgnify:FL=1
MILIKNVPLVPLQKAVFKMLKEGQAVKVYGSVPTNADLPYITIGSVTATPVSDKTGSLWNTAINIDVWAGAQQKQLVNDVLNDVCVLASYYGSNDSAEKMQLDGFNIINCSIGTVEAFPELTTGYHGTITLNFVIQNVD